MSQERYFPGAPAAPLRQLQQLPFCLLQYLFVEMKGTGSQAPLLSGLLATCRAATQGALPAARGAEGPLPWAEGQPPRISVAGKATQTPCVLMPGLRGGGRWTGTVLTGAVNPKEINMWIKLFKEPSQPSHL